MPKIIGSSLDEHRRQVREKVFDALRNQLYERGFEAITLSGVAAEAGVGRTAMYNHFPDREHLLVAFVEDEVSRYVTRLTDAVDAVDDPADKLAVFARLQLETLADYHLPPGATLASALAPSSYRRIAAHADPIGRMLNSILEEGMRRGRWPQQDVAVLAPMVSAALGARQVVDVPPEELPRAIDLAVAFVSRAVGVIPREASPEAPAHG
ncbi:MULTISPECIES: TetR/AcrR family transcriptional regulator [Prauserella salsuginis group]|uniref:AcrR family transcriptional regulator n=2 Tax=Prauserella salsuginis group TaxID=2893672 RepID=A0A839XU03_9PSEU|nr:MULTISPECIES: TetR/AcrR family transcriptional regulator [Prauserella salsuginis group]MBB3663486.1 AcrR family transcriptional regulator [Prauserella sediminis]MCR3720694.1 transcriptional regulator, TetR family [Prauserella flava]MCR3735225.1 transcriptional regulator, TetR family [Prauserella salsuginis]